MEQAAVGYLGWAGNMDTAIAVHAKDQQLHVQAGAGVVADSILKASGRKP